MPVARCRTQSHLERWVDSAGPGVREDEPFATRLAGIAKDFDIAGNHRLNGEKWSRQLDINAARA